MQQPRAVNELKIGALNIASADAFLLVAPSLQKAGVEHGVCGLVLLTRRVSKELGTG